MPIANLVTRETVPRTGTTHRTDGLRVIEVETDVEDIVLADDKVTEIKGLVASTGLDPRIAVKFRGEEQRAAETFLLKAFTDDLEPGTYFVLIRADGGRGGVRRNRQRIW